jgi:hypothetical protein
MNAGRRSAGCPLRDCRRYSEKIVNTERFWKIIEKATGHNPESAEEWDSLLVQQLVQLPENEILEWDLIFSELTSRAYRNDLWAAAYLINGGASDDGFYHFRCWLIGMGRDIFTNTLENPDSLADVVQPGWLSAGIDAEAEIYAAAYRAWQTVTGASEDTPYPVEHEKAELQDDDIDVDDDAALRRVLPRLCRMFAD